MPSDLQQQADSRLEGPARFGASTPGPPVGKGLNTPSIGAVAAVKPFADALAGTRPMEVRIVDHDRALGSAATCRRCCSLAKGINFGSQAAPISATSQIGTTSRVLSSSRRRVVVDDVGRDGTGPGFRVLPRNSAATIARERLVKAAVHRSSRNEDSRLTVNSCQECRCRLYCPVDGA